MLYLSLTGPTVTRSEPADDMPADGMIVYSKADRQELSCGDNYRTSDTMEKAQCD